MSAYPISGNQNFTKVTNTIVTTNAVVDALKAVGETGNYVTVIGYAMPTTVGVSSVVNSHGHPIVLNVGDVVVAATASGLGLVQGAGATVATGLALTDGGAVVGSPLTPATDLTTVAGVTGTTVTPVDSSATFLVAELAVADVTAGEVIVRLVVLPVAIN